MKKKFMTLGLATIMCLSLAACNSNNVMPEDDNTNTEDQVVIDKTQVEDFTDFTPSLELVDSSVKTENCLSIDGGLEYYKLNLTHHESLYEINFYNVDFDNAVENDYSFNAREFKVSFSAPMLKQDCYIAYDVPEVLPTLVVSFVATSGTTYDYMVAYNGRDGGADLIKLTDEQLTEKVSETKEESNYTEQPDEVTTVNTFEKTPEELLEKYEKENQEVILTDYAELSDKTWKCGEYTYKNKIILTGHLNNAEKDITYTVLSNKDNITFEQAGKASGLSSNTEDYFDVKDSIIVSIK